MSNAMSLFGFVSGNAVNRLALILCLDQSTKCRLSNHSDISICLLVN